MGGAFSACSRYGRRTTDHFAGFQITGRFRAAELAQFAYCPKAAPNSCAIPVAATGELAFGATRLKESRERELQALIAPERKEALTRDGIEPANVPGLRDAAHLGREATASPRPLTLVAGPRSEHRRRP